VARGYKYSKVPVKRAKVTPGQLLSRHAPTLLIIFVALSVIFLVQITTAGSDTDNSVNSDSELLLFLGNHNLPPMNYLENEKAKGLTVDIVTAIAERMERPVKIELMDWAEAQQLVLDGKADALIQINYTEERELLYDFSDPLLETEFAIFIPADKPGITNIFDLRELTVAAEAKGFSMLVLDRDPLINIRSVPDLLSGFNLLLEGSVDAVVGDRWVGSYTLAENNISGIAIAEQPIEINYSSIAVKKGSSVLLAEINRALDEIKKDGTYQRIVDRWQAKVVVYQTIEQVRQQRLILVGSLAAMLLALVFILALLYIVKKRKQAEADIRKLNAELESRIAERTTQLEAANSELEAFSYSVSHDLRAPLRAMSGFSKVLLTEYSVSLDDQGKHYLERIQVAANRMSELIDDLLTMSRVTRFDFKYEQVDLSKLATETIAALQEAEPQREAKPEISTGLSAWGDAALLRVVMENLLGNAWKFSAKVKEAHIEVGRTAIDIEEVFFIRDNGAGFDMSYADKLFGAFQRLHGAEEFPGTGVGLATVQRIIDRHGGRIWAKSEVGKGATFYFTLGRAKDEG
jgi:signal transduction histidine kinase